MSAQEDPSRTAIAADGEAVEVCSGRESLQHGAGECEFLRSGRSVAAPDGRDLVITSYSIHYTKLYDTAFIQRLELDAGYFLELFSRTVLAASLHGRELRGGVITSYSIHYTKLYEYACCRRCSCCEA